MSRLLVLAAIALFVAPAHGLCNTDDQKIWQTVNATYTWTNSRCATNCRDQPTCVSNCVSRALGFSHECATSIGELALCTRNACSGSRKRCTLCRCSVEAHCLSNFGTSSGLSLVNTPFEAKLPLEN